MNILMISPHSMWGGASIANISIAKLLSSCGNNVVYNDEYFPGEDYNGFPIDHTPYHTKRNELRNVICDESSKKGIELIIWTPAMAVYYFKQIRMLQKNGVYCMSILHSLSLGTTLKDRIIDIVQSYVLSKLNSIVYVSNYTLKSWDKFNFLRRSLAKKSVIYNSICPITHYTKEINATNRIRLGFVGRFSEEKQPEIFCKLSTVEKCELHAFGEGPLFDEMRSRYPGVVYHGLEKDQKKIYSNIDILIMTSQYENCPMVILEAMSRGIPCVAPRVGGIPEIIDDGLDGRLYEGYSIPLIMNAINDVADNYDRYVRSSMSSVSRFYSENIKQQWFKLLNEI